LVQLLLEVALPGLDIDPDVRLRAGTLLDVKYLLQAYAHRYLALEVAMVKHIAFLELGRGHPNAEKTKLIL